MGNLGQFPGLNFQSAIEFFFHPSLTFVGVCGFFGTKVVFRSEFEPAFFCLDSDNLIHLFQQMTKELLSASSMEKAFNLTQELCMASKRNFALKRLFWRVRIAKKYEITDERFLFCLLLPK